MGQIKGAAGATQQFIPLPSLLRWAGYSLMFLSNHLILRDPSSLLQSLGMLSYGSVAIRASLDIAFIVGLIGIGIFVLFRKRNLSVRSMLVFQSVLAIAFIPTILLCLDPQTTLAPEALLIFLLVSMGLFAAIGLEVWMVFLSAAGSGTAWLEIVLGLLVSSFAYGFLVFVIESVPSFVVFALVCLLSLLCSLSYYRLQSVYEQPPVVPIDTPMLGENPKEQPNNGAPKVPGQLNHLARALKDNISVFLCAIALGFALSASSMISVNDTSDSSINLMFTLGILCAALFFLWWVYAGRSPLSINVIYQIAFPILAFFFLLTPYMGNAFRYAFLLIAATAGTMGATSLFMAAFNSERQYGVSSMGLLGLFLGSSHIFYLLGWAGNLNGDYNFMWYATSTLLLVYVFVAITIISRRHRIQTQGPSPVVFVGSAEQLSNASERIIESSSLTPRESDIVRLLMQGKSVNDIADELVISPGTVRTHIKSVYKKLGIHARSELYELASL